jgi:hypothetical protein
MLFSWMNHEWYNERAAHEGSGKQAYAYEFLGWTSQEKTTIGKSIHELSIILKKKNSKIISENVNWVSLAKGRTLWMSFCENGEKYLSFKAGGNFMTGWIGLLGIVIVY